MTRIEVEGADAPVRAVGWIMPEVVTGVSQCWNCASALSAML
jgi:hypothetical protein